MRTVLTAALLLTALWLAGCKRPRPPRPAPRPPVKRGPKVPLVEQGPRRYRLGRSGLMHLDTSAILFDNGSSKPMTVRFAGGAELKVPPGNHALVKLKRGRQEYRVTDGASGEVKTFAPQLASRGFYVYNHRALRAYRVERKMYSIARAPGNAMRNTHYQVRGQQFFQVRYWVDYLFAPFPESVRTHSGSTFKVRLSHR